MNNVTPERKESVLKSLALIGLFGIVIFIAWVSVQIVSIFPTALQSLASIAETVYTYNPNTLKDITITPTTEPIISGTKHTLRWEQPYKNGMYSFTYKCRDGISVEIATSESNFTEAECEKKYNLGTVNNADIVINSEKQAEVDFDYTLSYFKTNATKESISTDDSLTVINTRFATTTPTVPKVTVNDEAITPTTPNVTKPISVIVPTKPPVRPKVTDQSDNVLYIPTSDPKGFTDLVVTYLGIGEKNTAGQFINNGFLRQNATGAIQFSVQNIGTKTSKDWAFTTKLPGDISYTSPTQSPLKPNERAKMIIAFPVVSGTHLQSFSITVTVPNDVKHSNDTITWTTAVLK